MTPAVSQAQLPEMAPVPKPAADSAAATNPLPGLPQIPDQPRSLYRPAPPTPPFACADPEKPYFVHDPELDPPGYPQPGWIFDADVAILMPHLKNGLSENVTLPNGTTNPVNLPTAGLDVAVAPRVEIGYRLPSGFGEFAISGRFLASQGNGNFYGLDGNAALKSRLDLNVIDLDYLSREYSLEYALGPGWGMKWFFGLRAIILYFDTAASEPYDVAAAGGGITDARDTNSYWGLGLHAGVEVERQWQGTGLAFTGRIDIGNNEGRIHQAFFEDTTAFGPDGRPIGGSTRDTGAQSVPEVNAQLGLTWQPPGCSQLSFFGGYEYEYWWNIGRMSTTLSRGCLFDQGIVLRAQFNY